MSLATAEQVVLMMEDRGDRMVPLIAVLVREPQEEVVGLRV